MRVLIVVVAALLATPAFAKDVTLTFDDQEQKVFLSLLDVALKQGGLSNLQAVNKFVQKYQAAIAPPKGESGPETPGEPVSPKE